MVTIKLDSYGENEFTGDAIIHKNEMEIVEKLLKKSVENAPKDIKDKSLKIPSYNCILVNGRRGAGKTSFLYSLKAKIEKDENDFSKSVCMLDLLDPTLIEEKAPIFLTIISLIKSKVDKNFESKYDDNTNLYDKKDWEKSLEELAKGLPLTSENSKTGPDFWDDASHILNKGLKDVSSAFNLRTNFNKFLDKSLSILQKKIFILFIDDVDTDFSKTFPLLETLRKYLCTPYIATVISGDFSLFSMAVRRRQWENFGKPLLINEYDKTAANTEIENQRKSRDKYLLNVTELEEQYLQKIFKPENRVQLRNLNEINTEGEIKVEKNGKKSKEDFVNFYSNIFEKFGIKNAYQCAAYYDFISEAPVRTQLNFMQCCQGSFDKPDVKHKLIALFSAELSQHDIDLYKIQEDNFLCKSLLKYLVSEHLLDEYYQLEPISADFTTNACVFTLSLLFSSKIQKYPYLFFDYALRIAYMRNLLKEIGYRSNENKELTIEGLIKHCSAYSDIDFRQMVCYMTAYLQSCRIDKNTQQQKNKTEKQKNKTDKKAQNGIIQLYAVENNEKGFNTVLKKSQLTELQKALVSLPLSGNNLGGNHNSVYTYSVFTLLGAIADIIREKDTKNSTKEILLRLSQLRAYPTSQINSYSESSDNEDEVTNKQEESDSKKTEKNTEKLEADAWSSFDKILNSWISFVNKLPFSTSTYVVAKITTRCFYAFASILQKNKNKNLAQVMELFVYQIINSALIEEYTEYKAGDTDFSLQSSNLVESVAVLRNNLKKVDFKENSFPITKMFITCPFLLVYLKKDDETDSAFSKVKEIVMKNFKQDFETLFDGNIFDVLQGIPLITAEK